MSAQRPTTPAQRLMQYFRDHPVPGVTMKLEHDYSAKDGSELPNAVALGDIQRTGEKGAGKVAMNLLCSKADEIGVALGLSVVPEKWAGLRSYYEQFGFQYVGKTSYGYHMMDRTSKAPEPTAGTDDRDSSSELTFEDDDDYSR